MIGRGRAASLRITDITVSREHATIQRIGDNYYLKDCKSKFGSIVRPTER
jgi:pSer/pThr/pTyr-binding forkhead associated (FHA) protein